MTGIEARLFALAEMVTGASRGTLIVWLYDQLYLPRPLALTDATAIPLMVGNGLQDAVNALTASLNIGHVQVASEDESLDGIGLAFHGLAATTGAEAEVTTRDRAADLISAIAYRQLGRGRLVGWLFSSGENRVETRSAGRDYRRITNLPFVPEEVEVEGLLRQFAAFPQSRILVEIFAEGSRDPNPPAGIARLWSVLEVLAENFSSGPGDDVPEAEPSSRAKVARALRHLGIQDPVEDDKPLTRTAYKIRNNFVHRGVVLELESANARRNEFADLVWFVLRRAGCVPVRPEVEYSP